MVFPKKMRNDKLNTKQFFIYNFYDFMFFADLDNTFTRSRALGWLFDPALQLLKIFIDSENHFYKILKNIFPMFLVPEFSITIDTFVSLVLSR